MSSTVVWFRTLIGLGLQDFLTRFGGAKVYMFLTCLPYIDIATARPDNDCVCICGCIHSGTLGCALLAQ